MKNTSYKTNLIIIFLYIGIAITFTILLLGIDNISFKKIDWIFHGNDMTHHYVGWSFFKNDIWRFPLGSNPNYGLEVSSSIVYADSIPLLAIFFKLFKNYLPTNFQYFSFWIFICFFFQGFIAYHLIKKYTNNFLYSVIGSFFFIIAPIFICRLGIHLALAGQWLILACFYIQKISTDKIRNITWNILIIISLLVHFYIAAMCIIIYGFFLLEEFIKNKRFKIFVSKLFLTSFLIVFVMYVSGYFMVPTIQVLGHGYGNLKMNLLSIFDPYQVNSEFTYTTWSYFLPDLPNLPGEEEGFSYIGLGGIILILTTFYFIFVDLLFKKKIFLNIFKKNIVYLFIFVFFFIFSLSNNIDFGKYELLHFDLNKYIYGLLSILRVSGRLIWPAYYIILVFCIIFLFKNIDFKKSLTTLIFLFFIQIVDFSPAFKEMIFSNKFQSVKKDLNNPLWEDIATNNKILRTTYVANITSIFLPLSYYLSENNIKTDIFWLSRYDRKKAAESRNNLYRKLNNGDLLEDPYIVGKENHLLNLKVLLKNKEIGFFNRDDLWVLVPNKKNFMNENDLIAFNKIKFPIMQVDKKITPNSDINNEFFGLGWTHNFSQTGLWTEGNISTILFKLPPAQNKKIFLEIEVEPHKIKGKNELKFSVFANNKIKKEFDLTKNPSIKKIILELENNEKNTYKIDIKFINPKSPLDELVSPDARKLGLLVKSIVAKTYN